jgi:hypothetical protein
VLQIAQYSVTFANAFTFPAGAHGDTAGLVLTNGLEVRFPLHFSAEVLAVARAGDRVTVYGGARIAAMRYPA